MKKSIFKSICIAAGAVFLATMVIIFGALYDYFSDTQQTQLKAQTELAARAGVTRQTIGLIESGEFNPSIKLCIAICKALDTTLNDLFWEDEENEEK